MRDDKLAICTELSSSGKRYLSKMLLPRQSIWLVALSGTRQLAANNQPARTQAKTVTRRPQQHSTLAATPPIRQNGSFIITMMCHVPFLHVLLPQLERIIICPNTKDAFEWTSENNLQGVVVVVAVGCLLVVLVGSSSAYSMGTSE